MAKGASSKQAVTEKLLEVFSGSFLYNDGKEIRIPMVENGEEVQIKVTLTAAKVNVSVGDDIAVPGAIVSFANELQADVGVPVEIKVTAEEQERVKNLMASLNL